MYLREMGTVPLLTREGEVEIASASSAASSRSSSRSRARRRSPRRSSSWATSCTTGERTIRELVIFNDEEITDERIDERARQVLKQIDAVRKARAVSEKLEEKLAETPKGATTRDKRKYRRARWAAMRARVELSQLHPRDRVHRVGQAPPDRRDEGRGRGASSACSARSKRIDRQLNPKNKKQKLQGRGEEEPAQRQIRSSKLKLKAMTDELEQEPDRAEAARSRRSCAASTRPSRRRRSWSKPTSASSSRSRRSTPTAACSSST